jgi:hypothetical protein
MSRKKLLPLDEAKKRLKIHMQLKYPEILSTYDGYVPKFFIPEPRGRFHGLFLELKGEGSKTFTKAGEPTKCSSYSASTFKNMKRLEDNGFKCEVVRGYEEARIAIEKYLGK